jgi:hypothetical protein
LHRLELRVCRAEVPLYVWRGRANATSAKLEGI